MDSEEIVGFLKTRDEHNAKQLGIVEKIAALEEDAEGMVRSVHLKDFSNRRVHMAVYLNTNFGKDWTSFLEYLTDRGLIYQDGFSVGFGCTRQDDDFLLKYDHGVSVRFVDKDSDNRTAA